MPEAMCSSTIGVPQWYMKTPGIVERELELDRLPGAIERYLSCGDTIAEWKSIECIIGAAVTRTPGTGSSQRLVMENLIRSPTRARTSGPGTWSPKVQALNFTPGAISMIL